MSMIGGFIYRQFLHDPPKPTTSFNGMTAIVTGSNTGLGLEACRMMVRLGASKVILACRNLEKGNAAAKDIQTTTLCPRDALEVWHLDMNSYASVLAFSDRAKAELPRLDVLIANAGIMALKFRTTEEDEESITANCVSLSLLACLLHPILHDTAVRYNTNTHITVTASELYEVAKFKESKVPDGQIFATLSDEKKSDIGDRYNVSKLLDVLIVRQIAVLSPFRSSKVIVNSVAPGMCDSELGREHPLFGNKLAHVIMRFMARTTEVGARTLVWGASAGPESHGQYVPDCKITTNLRGLAKGEAGVKLQERIWAELREKLEAIQPGVTALN